MSVTDTPGRPQAIAYAGLLGRWIDVGRVSDGLAVGMAGVVEEVHDTPSGVEVILDYGYGVVITSDDATDWHFRIRVEEPS
jgi:hypothetical protein